MKKVKQLLIIVLLGNTFALFSQQKVALHSSSGIQHFNGVAGFLNAYNTASPGDTIYLPSGGFTSPNYIDKSLMIFGAGHYPDSTTATSKTSINGGITFRDNADGFYIEGVDFNGDINFYNNESINNVTIKYSRFNNFSADGNLTNPSSNLAIINCVLSGSLYLQNVQDAAIFNSIVQLNIAFSQGNLFENNIILFNDAYSMYACNSNTINNNIFINPGSGAYFLGFSNNIHNNLFVQAAPGYGTTPVTSGNYVGVALNNIFVNHAGYAFSYANDYHLQNPITYLGIDGTQVGVYGGIHSKEGAVPSNPHIQINNSATQTDNNGDLNINIQVEAQDQ